jgi:acylphosphatase
MKTAKHTVEVEGTLRNKGFGFLCMQLASKYKITGTLFYKTGEIAVLDISGDYENIQKMLNRCREEDYIKKIEILNKNTAIQTINDFLLLNQI